MSWDVCCPPSVHSFAMSERRCSVYSVDSCGTTANADVGVSCVRCIVGGGSGELRRLREEKRVLAESLRLSESRATLAESELTSQKRRHRLLTGEFNSLLAENARLKERRTEAAGNPEGVGRRLHSFVYRIPSRTAEVCGKVASQEKRQRTPVSQNDESRLQPSSLQSHAHQPSTQHLLPMSQYRQSRSRSINSPREDVPMVTAASRSSIEQPRRSSRKRGISTAATHDLTTPILAQDTPHSIVDTPHSIVATPRKSYSGRSVLMQHSSRTCLLPRLLK